MIAGFVGGRGQVLVRGQGGETVGPVGAIVGNFPYFSKGRQAGGGTLVAL